MHPPTVRLLSIASGPIGGVIGRSNELSSWGGIGEDIAEMLAVKNGFYAYESALLVRPLHSALAPLGLREWNSPNLWKKDYRDVVGNALFFAEDVFGGQYCIHEGQICTFDPETGLFQPMCCSLGAWADEVMSDYAFRTGYPLAHDWQIANGPLMAGERLSPKVPFVCGGKYELDNLYSLPDQEGMRFRASIANQIRDLPDGAEIVLKPPTSRSLHG